MRVGGRGCPACGSHDTLKPTHQEDAFCKTCRHIWTPCSMYCRGYRFDFHDPNGPMVVGCKECGVPDQIARTWPEAVTQLGRDIGKRVDKYESTLRQFPIKVSVVSRASGEREKITPITSRKR